MRDCEVSGSRGSSRGAPKRRAVGIALNPAPPYAEIGAASARPSRSVSVVVFKEGGMRTSIREIRLPANVTLVRASQHSDRIVAHVDPFAEIDPFTEIDSSIVRPRR